MFISTLGIVAVLLLSQGSGGRMKESKPTARTDEDVKRWARQQEQRRRRRAEEQRQRAKEQRERVEEQRERQLRREMQRWEERERKKKERIMNIHLNVRGRLECLLYGESQVHKERVSLEELLEYNDTLKEALNERSKLAFEKFKGKV